MRDVVADTRTPYLYYPSRARARVRATHVAQVNVNCHFILRRQLIFRAPRDPRKLYSA